jgi:hypothetical protein
MALASNAPTRRARISRPPWKPTAPARAATSSTPSWSRPRQSRGRTPQGRGDQPETRGALRPDGRARYRSAQAPDALEGRHRARPAQHRVLAWRWPKPTWTRTTTAKPAKPGAAANRPPPTPPSARSFTGRACWWSSSASITRRPRSARKPRRRRARSPNSRPRPSPTFTRPKPNTATARRWAPTSPCPGGTGRSPRAKSAAR